MGKTINDLGCRPSYLYQNLVQPGTRGLVLHVEPITCGQEDATDVVVESYLKLFMSSSDNNKKNCNSH